MPIVVVGPKLLTGWRMYAFGTLMPMSSTFVKLRSVSASELNVEIAIGVVCRFSSRNCAVTTTSSSPESAASCA